MFSLIIKKIIFKCAHLLPHKDLLIADMLLHRLMIAGEFSEDMSHAYWERAINNWGDMPSPFRPSEGDIAIYKELFEKTKHKEQILILGSTPELRDLVARSGKSHVCIADFSYHAPAKMLAFTSRVDPSRETWIKGNWLDLPLPQYSFDIIFGDLALEQLPPDKELFFLSRVHSLLKKEGIFIGRFRFMDHAYIHKTIDEIIGKTVGGIGSEREKFLLLTHRLRMRYADPIRRLIAFDDCLADLAHHIETKDNVNPIVYRTQRALGQNREINRIWCPPDEIALKKILAQVSTITDIRFAADYEEASHHPIIALAPQ